MAKATIEDLANLATATATDRSVVETLTEAKFRLDKQLEDRSNELKVLSTLLQKIIFGPIDTRWQISTHS
jgi:hypothetical protein